MNPSYLFPVANHLWQSTLFACAGGLLTLALRKNHARVRHWVWLATSLKFLIPLSLLVGMGGLIRWQSAPKIAPSSLAVVMDEVSRPFVAPAFSLPLSVTATPAANPVAAVLWGIWACGFVGITGSWWIRWRRILATVRSGSPMQLAIPIPAISSPTLLEPGIFGVFRPVLLLPEGIVERLTATQLQAVLAHEYCHIRYRDNLIAAIHMFVETVFWFHPLVWWIGKRMVEERERACDEEVVRLGSEPRVYAEGILNICKHYVESPLLCVAGVTGSNLKKRIEAIMSNRITIRLNFAKRAVLAFAAMMAVVIPIAVGIMNPSGSLAQSPPTHETFEAASVKLNKIGGEGCSATNSGGQTYTSRNCPLLSTILFVYGVTQEQVSATGSMPVLVEKYDIIAKAEHSVSRVQMKRLLQSLLEDRFSLKMHREMKEMPVYALVVGKDGPKFPQSRAGIDEGPSAGAGRAGQPIMQNTTMSEFLALLSRRITDRVLVDRTGLTGHYDLGMKWFFELVKPDAPSVFTAIQELGLKLEPGKEAVDFLTIDHIERPSEN